MYCELVMDPSKNRNKRKLLACFKPVVEEDGDPYDSTSPSNSEHEGEGKRKMKARLRFSSAMKAVLFKVSLVEKLKSRKSRQDAISDSSSESKRLAILMKTSSSFDKFLDTGKISRTNSSISSLFSSSNPPSSRASSSSPDSRPGSEKNIKRSVSLNFKQTKPNKYYRQQSVIKKDIRSKYSSKGLCITVVFLVALIFWGKAFAIMACTSAWLLSTPTRRSQTIDSTLNEVDDHSDRCKKRVVVEGYDLEKSH